jgi:hypothetical protein
MPRPPGEPLSPVAHLGGSNMSRFLMTATTVFASLLPLAVVVALALFI